MHQFNNEEMDKMQSKQHTLREETLTHNTLSCTVCLKKHPIWIYMNWIQLLHLVCKACTAIHKTRSPPPPALQYGWKKPITSGFCPLTTLRRWGNWTLALCRIQKKSRRNARYVTGIHTIQIAMTAVTCWHKTLTNTQTYIYWLKQVN